MELRAYRAILWRRKWIILLTLGITVAVAVIGTMLSTPVYAATATVRVSVTSGSIDYVVRDSTYTDRLINTYVSLATSHAVTKQVMDELELEAAPSVSVAGPANSELIQITAEDPSAVRAAQIANAIANALVVQAETHSAMAEGVQDDMQAALLTAGDALRQARATYETLAADPQADPADLAAARADLDVKETAYNTLLNQFDRAQVTAAARAVNVTVVDQAVPRNDPARPSWVLNLGIGSVVGLVAAAGLAFLAENLDDRLHGTAAVRSLIGAPILARIPAARRRLFRSRDDTDAAMLESFRRLRTNVLAHRSCRTVLVTSTEEGEGRSTVLLNLAIVLGSAESTVAVVDADLRQPILDQMFGLPNKVGLSDVLEGTATADVAIQDSDYPGVQVLTSGSPSPTAPDLLGSERMRELLQHLAARFDLVLLDTPALRRYTDAALLAGMVDGVVLVVQSGRARRGAVQAALTELATVQARLLGIVVNQAGPDDDAQPSLTQHPVVILPDENDARIGRQPPVRSNGRFQFTGVRGAGRSGEVSSRLRRERGDDLTPPDEGVSTEGQG